MYLLAPSYLYGGDVYLEAVVVQHLLDEGPQQLPEHIPTPPVPGKQQYSFNPLRTRQKI